MTDAKDNNTGKFNTDNLNAGKLNTAIPSQHHLHKGGRRKKFWRKDAENKRESEEVSTEAYTECRAYVETFGKLKMDIIAHISYFLQQHHVAVPKKGWDVFVGSMNQDLEDLLEEHHKHINAVILNYKGK